MPSRSEMDLPATVIVVILGAVLIFASVPFLDEVGSAAGGNEYLIRWSEVDTGSAQANAGAAGSTTTVRVPVTDVLPSNATVALESCNDGAQPPATQPATISWTLYEGDEEKGSGTFQCSDEGDSESIAQESHPDVGQATAGSASAAAQQAYAAGDNETVEYRLEFTWSRASGPLPTPLPVPVAFSATLSLTVEHWVATAVEPDAEVPR